MKRILITAAALSLACAAPAAAQVAALPPPGAGMTAYAPFEHLVGRSWRGTGTKDASVQDVQRWDWAVGGHAVQVVHSVNDGAYAGETIIFRDKDSGAYIFHYFTSGGFHSTGTIRPTGPGAFEVEETIHGLDGFPPMRSTIVMGADGVNRSRSFKREGDAWVEQGGFDYREDPGAVAFMPRMGTSATGDGDAPVTLMSAPAPRREAAASAGPLDLTRRVLRHVDEPGQDVAAYVLIRNGDPVADELISVSCACAERVELHRIDRSGPRPDMVSDPAWSVPGRGELAVRPGSPLHFMLIGYDPAKARDGRVPLTLTFRTAGTVTADFALTDDSAAGWAAFD
ncbi:copper chaperone PCu(A)C [Brevundimonas sp.]|jgi:copper(I)-binding protein|uniref:copper chaperone PCu(A)C n=1 Tax=Brevundimonas sp. TaxID=1871086 RepID=UPI002E13F73E|nr:copper chaperone PCu(A)C [Brevundimonas sp.]